MFILFSIIALFLLVSIYLFFRAEGLQKELSMAKREAKQIGKDNKALVESMMMSANKNEEFARFRLNELKKLLPEESLNDELKNDTEMLTLLTSCYGSIYRECLKGKAPLKTITKTCLDSISPSTFSDFTHYIANQDIGIKRIWATNNLQGFISLVEALLLQLDKNVRAKILEETKA